MIGEKKIEMRYLKTDKNEEKNDSPLNHSNLSSNLTLNTHSNDPVLC